MNTKKPSWYSLGLSYRTVPFSLNNSYFYAVIPAFLTAPIIEAVLNSYLSAGHSESQVVLSIFAIAIAYVSTLILFVPFSIASSKQMFDEVFKANKAVTATDMDTGEVKFLKKRKDTSGKFYIHEYPKL
jgi:hypothetical protein